MKEVFFNVLCTLIWLDSGSLKHVMEFLGHPHCIFPHMCVYRPVLRVVKRGVRPGFLKIFTVTQNSLKRGVRTRGGAFEPPKDGHDIYIYIYIYIHTHNLLNEMLSC